MPWFRIEAEWEERHSEVHMIEAADMWEAGDFAAAQRGHGTEHKITASIPELTITELDTESGILE